MEHLSCTQRPGLKKMSNTIPVKLLPKGRVFVLKYDDDFAPTPWIASFYGHDYNGVFSRHDAFGKSPGEATYKALNQLEEK